MDSQVSFRNQARAHRFSVNQAAIAAERFQRMSDRMSIVQNPPIRLPFIRRHHFRLDFAGAGHGPHDCLGVQFQQVRHGRLQERKQRFIGDDAVLDHLRKARDPFAAGQGLKHEGIDDDRLGLMERADQVLPKPMVHSCFSSDAGIHLRHQRGRDLHIRNAALIDRGCEPARSPTTPPPSATTSERRSNLCLARTSRIRATVARVLVRSPGGTTTGMGSRPACFSESTVGLR